MAAPILKEDINKDLDELDNRLTQLKVSYDKYFLGMEKFEPLKDRADVYRIIMELAGRFVRNTGSKFRRDQLKSKFLSYARYWDRILKQIEEGTYRGHRVKAELHERERLEKERRRNGGVLPGEEATGTAESAPVAAANGAPRPAAPVWGDRPAAAQPPSGAAAKADPVQRILDQFVAAKTKVGERTEGLTREKMAAVIQQQSAALKQKYNCKSVEFRVVVEDGKAKLKAIPKT